jgi:hypothetical protein
MDDERGRSVLEPHSTTHLEMLRFASAIAGEQISGEYFAPSRLPGAVLRRAAKLRRSVERWGRCGERGGRRWRFDHELWHWRRQ